MTTESVEPRRLYRLSPLDRTGVLLGLSIVQIIVTGTGITLGAIVMATANTIVGIAIAIITTAIGVVRIHGEAVLHQLPTTIRYVRKGRSASASSATWLAPLPILGPVTNPNSVPPALDRQKLHHIDPTDFGVAPSELRGPVAMIIDKRAGLYAVTVRVAGRQFGLLESHEQDSQLAQWGNVIAQFVQERPIITQIHWSEWAAPAGINEHRDWLETHKSAQPIADALKSWEQLIAESGPIATRHEVLLTITSHPSRIRTQRRHGSRHGATIEALLKETRALLLRLDGAGLYAAALTPREHTRNLRLRLDPSIRATLDRREALLGGAAGFVSDINSGPLATKESWTSFATDNAIHRSFYVAEWPRLDVRSDWIRELMLWSGCVRSINVFFQPVPRSKSIRAITAQATKIEADMAHRTEKGFRVGASHRRAMQGVTERDEELVAGFVELSYGGVVTVTATSTDELDQASADITQVAASVGIELRPLHGRHAEAFIATLPIARGLRPRG